MGFGNAAAAWSRRVQAAGGREGREGMWSWGVARVAVVVEGEACGLIVVEGWRGKIQIHSRWCYPSAVFNTVFSVQTQAPKLE
eukprot:scaffold92739_cov27-Tisochrysis_lutea.AAC.1